MMPEEAVVARLLEMSAVTAIVGTRVYLDRLPQRPTYPAVLVQAIDELTDYHLRGGQRGPARVQVDAYAPEADGVDVDANVMALAEAIHGDDAGSGLSGWLGDVGSPPFRITGIFRIDRAREYEPAELRLLRQRQDYVVHFKV